MFYDIFTSLCEKRGTTPARVRFDLGISQSTMASWKSRQLTPNATTLQKIADYLYVPVDYLLGAELESDDYDQLVSSGKMLGNSLYRLHKAEQTGDPQEKIERTRKFCLTVTEDMWDYVPGGLAMAQRRYGESTSSSWLPALDELSDIGKQKVVDYASDLAKIPEYQREQPEAAPQSPSPSPEGTDTTPPPEGE